MTVSAEADAVRFLLVSGKPIGEPILAGTDRDEHPGGAAHSFEELDRARSSRRSDGDSTWRYLRHSESEDGAARHACPLPKLDHEAGSRHIRFDGRHRPQEDQLLTFSPSFHSDGFGAFGGRSRSKLLELLLKVEAAGIEPGQLDDLGAVSPRHLAQVRDPPRGMGGPRALLRVPDRHPAVSVDQRDHGGPAQRSQPCSMVPTSCSCSESRSTRWWST